MEKKTTEQINREFMEDPNIPMERKELVANIMRAVSENMYLSDEELDRKYFM